MDFAGVVRELSHEEECDVREMPHEEEGDVDITSSRGNGSPTEGRGLPSVGEDDSSDLVLAMEDSSEEIMIEDLPPDMMNWYFRNHDHLY